MQLESSQQYQFPLASSSGPEGGSNNAPPRKGSLSVLIDGDMTRFGEIFDSCPGISAAFFDRSRHSSFAESNQHQHLHHQQPVEHQEQQYHEQQLHRQHQEHLHGYAPSSDPAAHDGPDWACSALIEDGSMISCPPESSVAFATVSDYNREADANYSVPYFGVPCWVGDHAAADGLTPLPIDSGPDGNSHGGGGFGHFQMDPLEHGKDAPSSSLDAPSPAHMEHFMPFVHHGEPEMIFAGMDLSHAEFQNWHMNHQTLPHQLEHGQQQHAMFFPGCAPSDGGDIDQFIPLQHQQHSHNHHQAMLQFNGSEHGSSAIMGLHDKTQPEGDGSSPWSAAGGFHAPLPTTTHFIKNDARKNALYREPTSAGVASLKNKVRSSTTVTASQRVLRGRSSSSAPVAPLPPSGATALLNNSTQQKAKSSASSSPFQAELRLVTVLNDCYWKNGRKNLQCFPACPEHNDFYSMKMNNRKHSSVGVCRGPVYCHVIAKAAQPLRLGGTTTGNGGGSEASGSLPGSSVSSSSLSSSSRRLGMASTVHASCAATLPSIPSGQHMKYEHGVGASGSGGSAQELFVLGRFERVPQRDNTDLVEELGDPPEFSSSIAFEEFRYSCFQAVEMKERRTRLGATSSADRENLPYKGENANANANATSSASEDAASITTATSSDSNGDGTPLVRSTWFFLPDVWKVQPMLKKKRKATRSAPAQTFPFCFRVFVYTADGSGGYACVSSTVSSFFELYSTRTVDRVKRKYWSKSSDAASAKRHARGIGEAPCTRMS